MRHEPDAIGQPSCHSEAAMPSARSFGWRHPATVLLLLVTLPVFAAGGVVALAALPFVLAVAGLDQLRQFLRPAPEPVPVRAGH
ncbi:hypothetical protein FSC37_17380 [Piscinibacter aquaticus]|uniref:Uncharacterized protein n=1 Tax=Piscinibacter aquaticus TaxID=392597 RepID=A0A5C6U1J4_9BURK|nr:hypothetical protein FSC37_17380 [Piscinibacter aquaticus]